MKNLIRKILKENTINNKEKMISLIEKLLNNQVKKIQFECENFEEDDLETIPDDIATDTCRKIYNIDKIKVTDIKEHNDILMIYVNVDIDSIFQHMDVVEVLYDVKQRVSKMIGQRITLIEVEVNNIKTNREW